MASSLFTLRFFRQVGVPIALCLVLIFAGCNGVLNGNGGDDPTAATTIASNTDTTSITTSHIDRSRKTTVSSPTTTTAVKSSPMTATAASPSDSSQSAPTDTDSPTVTTTPLSPESVLEQTTSTTIQEASATTEASTETQGGPSSSTETMTTASPQEESYPYARHCSYTWADISISSVEYNKANNTTTVRGVAENTVDGRYAAQVSVEFNAPTDPEGVVTTDGTQVNLDPTETATWKITVEGRIQNVRTDGSSFVEECTSNNPPWNEIPIDYTNYPECTVQTSSQFVEDIGSTVGNRTTITVKARNYYGAKVTAKFRVEYTINGETRTIKNVTHTLPPGGSITYPFHVNNMGENITDASVRVPTPQKDCELIYGEP